MQRAQSSRNCLSYSQLPSWARYILATSLYASTKKPRPNNSQRTITEDGVKELRELREQSGKYEGLAEQKTLPLIEEILYEREPAYVRFLEVEALTPHPRLEKSLRRRVEAV
jgi:hypothetical protein